MARTCIIGGGPTGSREHIFPAALGGRRVNKGIYCGKHNNDYSPLAAILSRQLKAINAFLGVRGDHADEAHAINTTDSASGRRVTLSSSENEFAEPQVASESTQGNTRTATMMFSSERQIQEWIQAQLTLGNNVRIGKREPVQRYFLSGSEIRLELGGPEGLRAIGYVAQTFLAHYFPDVARTSELKSFKDYTLGKADGEFVWWDFESPAALPPNAFEFGHRVVVGIDPANASVYARVSLFSAMHFAVLFGLASAMPAQAVIVDIDPLAEHPPGDIKERREPSAAAAVTRPRSLTASLSEAISSGRAQRSFAELMKQIAARNLTLTTQALLEKLKGGDRLDAEAREKLFAAILDQEAQRVLNLMRYVIEGLKASDARLAQLLPGLDQLVAPDPTKPNGLSDEAAAALGRAQQALVVQILDDYTNDRLDDERLGLLIGGGPGAAIVGQAILGPIIPSDP